MTRKIFFLPLVFLFGIACMYSSFDALVEADFLSAKKYEAGDLEEVYAEKQSSPDAVLVSPGLFSPLSWTAESVPDIPALFSLLTHFTVSPLRC
ncbi:MAG TPA: hypothetical protein VLS90_04020 [Thermodesulfobacteriota bacterium]|nr:hypothetical protein [Thermodesulfobacteriota bacterium]